MQIKGGFHTVGRRKTSVARIFLRDGEGHITVNGLPYDQYFDRPTLRLVMNQPLVVAERTTKYDLLINVAGGGKSGQAGAVLQGIARALCEAEPELRKILKPEHFLTRDSREVERKKYGRHKARKRPQFSKR